MHILLIYLQFLYLKITRENMIEKSVKAKQNLHSKNIKKSDNFVFIHINKTGGSSIENALKIPFEHKTALEKIEEIGLRNWNKSLSFTVIRNPWDKVVSHFLYRVKRNISDLQTNPIDFTEWVKRSYGVQDPFYFKNPKMFMPQTNWISDENGQIIVDEIIHFERLECEFKDILVKLGKQATLPHLKKSNRLAYEQYYDEESKIIVEDWFEQDIRRFGYEF